MKILSNKKFNELQDNLFELQLRNNDLEEQLQIAKDQIAYFKNELKKFTKPKKVGRPRTKKTTEENNAR